MSTFVLRRSALVTACSPGLAQHAARAAEQAGVDFGDVVGNGIDTYYPDGFSDADWLRIAETSARRALWILEHHEALGLPQPSRETFAQIRVLLREQRGAR